MKKFAIAVFAVAALALASTNASAINITLCPTMVDEACPGVTLTALDEQKVFAVGYTGNVAGTSAFAAFKLLEYNTDDNFLEFLVGVKNTSTVVSRLSTIESAPCPMF